MALEIYCGLILGLLDALYGYNFVHIVGKKIKDIRI